jgi:hypothetical protein
MDTASPNPLSAPRLPVFAISCWALGLIGFSQLFIAAMALATRFDESKQVRTVIKEVPKLIAVRIPAPRTEPSLAAVIARPPAPDPTNDLPAPTPLAMPVVEDPHSELLLKEARRAKVAGDMDVAITKLEDALAESPDDPSLHYELGLVFEQMGVYDSAAAHFQKVNSMGTDAGALYQLAAAKLRDGVEPPEAALGKLSLARVRIFKDPKNDAGQRVVLTIPVQKAPGEEIENLVDIAVVVTFFNRNSKGEIVELEPENKSWVTGADNWISLPFDWAGGEETLRMTYTIPPQDVQTEHLFGGRTYYGQVVTLLYQGVVLDVQAWPRDLAARMGAQSAAPRAGAGEPLLPEFQDTLPPDFDQNQGLLPPLPSK